MTLLPVLSKRTCYAALLVLAVRHALKATNSFVPSSMLQVDLNNRKLHINSSVDETGSSLEAFGLNNGTIQAVNNSHLHILHIKHETKNQTSNSRVEEVSTIARQATPDRKIKCWNPETQCSMARNKNMTSAVEASRYHRISSFPSAQGNRTLALVDPSLRDGYRNQFMRFVSFTTYALTNGFQQMLLPSIRWNCDHRKVKHDAVPFELLFDVDHWNSDTDLPHLVGYNESEHFDWDPFTGLFRNACDVLNKYHYNGPQKKNIIFERSSHFQHPVPHGGGNSLGTLFYDYLHYDRRRPTLLLKDQNKSSTFLELEAKITRAMKPSAIVERMIQETLGKNGEPPYIALHARIEPEMLVHTMCRHVKVYNLTDVFDMIRGMDHNADMINASMYIAIGMKEMEEGNPFKWFQTEHRRNMEALQDAMSYGLDLPSGKNLTVSVGGHTAFRSNEIDTCAHEILSSVISFEIAVRAKIFIGTYISSWSTTVWKARHYLGRGENYAYTPNGLEKIDGVPKPFRC